MWLLHHKEVDSNCNIFSFTLSHLCESLGNAADLFTVSESFAAVYSFFFSLFNFFLGFFFFPSVWVSWESSVILISWWHQHLSFFYAFFLSFLLMLLYPYLPIHTSFILGLVFSLQTSTIWYWKKGLIGTKKLHTVICGSYCKAHVFRLVLFT